MLICSREIGICVGLTTGGDNLISCVFSGVRSIDTDSSGIAWAAAVGVGGTVCAIPSVRTGRNGRLRINRLHTGGRAVDCKRSANFTLILLSLWTSATLPGGAGACPKATQQTAKLTSAIIIDCFIVHISRGGKMRQRILYIIIGLSQQCGRKTEHWYKKRAILSCSYFSAGEICTPNKNWHKPQIGVLVLRT